MTEKTHVATRCEEESHDDSGENHHHGALSTLAHGMKRIFLSLFFLYSFCGTCWLTFSIFYFTVVEQRWQEILGVWANTKLVQALCCPNVIIIVTSTTIMLVLARQLLEQKKSFEDVQGTPSLPLTTHPWSRILGRLRKATTLSPITGLGVDEYYPDPPSLPSSPSLNKEESSSTVDLAAMAQETLEQAQKAQDEAVSAVTQVQEEEQTAAAAGQEKQKDATAAPKKQQEQKQKAAAEQKNLLAEQKQKVAQERAEKKRLLAEQRKKEAKQKKGLLAEQRQKAAEEAAEKKRLLAEQKPKAAEAAAEQKPKAAEEAAEQKRVKKLKVKHAAAAQEQQASSQEKKSRIEANHQADEEPPKLPKPSPSLWSFLGFTNKDD